MEKRVTSYDPGYKQSNNAMKSKLNVQHTVRGNSETSTYHGRLSGRERQYRLSILKGMKACMRKCYR